MNPIAIAKSYARLLRTRPYLDLDLSQGHALELVTALLSQAKSWNEFTAQPTAPQLPDTMSEYFGAITRTQRRLQALEVCPIWVRGLRSTAAVHFLDSLFEVAPFAQSMWSLMDRLGVVGITTIIDNELKTATLPDGPEFLESRLSRWFIVDHVGLDRKYGEYPWDHTEALALKMGFSKREASMIRQVQREAPNHTWSLDLWFEVGVLDPDQSAFLHELKAQPDWHDQFENLYATDAGRIPEM